MTSTTLPRVCVIGAGPSGITAAKRLLDHDIPFDCYEASDDVGGTWYFKNPNGMSACYQSLHIDTSKKRLELEDYPVPDEWPDFPHHSQLFQYFRDYADHFGLRDRILFETTVTSAVRDADGCWEVTTNDGKTRHYDALLVCNGHHWDPRVPDYPGEFDGTLLHSHAYNDPFDPIDMRGKNVVVVGMGNSGLDIASELSQRYVAARLHVSTRRGIWVLPKYIKGRTTDSVSVPRWFPPALALKVKQFIIWDAGGRMRNYGLPEPDHRPLEAHPSASEEFLHRAGCGDIAFKPAIAALEGPRVRFTDGSTEEVDVIICATGYHISFPFFSDPDLLPGNNNRFPLFKYMMKPEYDNLFFLGLAQSLPTLVNFAEQQSKLVAAYLTGRYRLPSIEQMHAAIRSVESAMARQFYDSPRHTIEVEFDPYVRDIRRELARGAKRAAAVGYSLPISPRAHQRDEVKPSTAATRK
ncbi:NAD(P)/FAD-dependent oxidoreductase [Nocardia sp. CNY236]|uniref:flavin-containing monooxygenase n=1 Tax=Nocardia sp. CNY236 TaxID=1169152 RepID=UPI00048B7271|nr:NAD(P)-binding domain-containing protein [Nocardia sp. CNY236]